MTAFNIDAALPYLSPAQSSEDTAPIHAYGSADAPISRHFSRSLLVTYVVDEPGVLVFVRERDVPDKRDARDELHARAVTNLRSHLAQRSLRFEPCGDSHHVRFDGLHDASLLLLDELWDPPTARLPLPTGIHAAVPARGTLMLATTLPPLRSHLQKVSLSAEIFVRRDRQWHPSDGF